MTAQDDLRALILAKTRAFSRISELAKQARLLIDEREREAIRAVDGAMSVKEKGAADYAVCGDWG